MCSNKLSSYRIQSGELRFGGGDNTFGVSDHPLSDLGVGPGYNDQNVGALTPDLCLMLDRLGPLLVSVIYMYDGI